MTPTKPDVGERSRHEAIVYNPAPLWGAIHSCMRIANDTGRDAGEVIASIVVCGICRTRRWGVCR